MINESSNLFPVDQSGGFGALHSTQNALIQGFKCFVHARHDPSLFVVLIRAYFCCCGWYVKPIVMQTLISSISG